MDAADTNDDGTLNISDAVTLFGVLFTGETTVAAPFPALGTDTTADGLGCTYYGG
jgi:hypothetical protein